MAPEPERSGAAVNTFSDTWRQQKAAPVTDFAAWERELKADEKWSLQLKGERKLEVATAVVKGAGPAGLSAALELDKLGYNVVLVDCRDANKRMNIIAARAEMNRLHELGALKHLKEHDRWIQVAARELFDEWTQQYLEVKPPVFFDQPGYVRPETMGDQISTHFISIADLETSLGERQTQGRDQSGYINATIRVTRREGTKRDHVTLFPKDASQPSVDLGFPDLVVWATGKRDPDLQQNLRITQQWNLDLTAGRDEPLLEPQAFLLFQLKPRNPVPRKPYLHTVLTKELCDAKPQKLVRAWASTHTLINCTVQLPGPYGIAPRNRRDPPDASKVAAHARGQVNAETRHLV